MVIAETGGNEKRDATRRARHQPDMILEIHLRWVVLQVFVVVVRVAAAAGMFNFRHHFHIPRHQLAMLEGGGESREELEEFCNRFTIFFIFAPVYMGISMKRILCFFLRTRANPVR